MSTSSSRVGLLMSRGCSSSTFERRNPIVCSNTFLRCVVGRDGATVPSAWSSSSSFILASKRALMVLEKGVSVIELSIVEFLQSLSRVKLS